MWLHLELLVTQRINTVAQRQQRLIYVGAFDESRSTVVRV